MRKVVHLTPYYWPHIGGVETHLQQVNRELLKSHPNLSLSVITIQHDPTLPLTETHEGVTIYRLPAKPHAKLSVWSQIWQHLQLLMSADIIHIHDIFWWLIPLLPFLPRRQLFMTFHGYEGNQLPKWNHVFWRQVAARLTAGSIAIGAFQKKWYGITPTLVSHGAVESKKQPVKRKKDTTLKAKKLIFIGRLEADNGIIKYLEAVKILKAEGKSIKLDVYGDGGLRPTAERFVKKYSLPVTFHGFVDQAAINYSQYDLAFASRYLSILEALAAGVPVIAQYTNDLQRDYLQLAPFAQWIAMAEHPRDISHSLKADTHLPPAAQKWAAQQTWAKLAAVYRELWKAKK
ncbi:MAG TPA: glycosyltransferase family 4 protein [Patescibacteria group bacterium]